MATFTLDFECDNAAFDDDPTFEIARILKETAEKIKCDNVTGFGYAHGVIRDINGNRVGDWKYRGE